jgi:hypothetical protein
VRQAGLEITDDRAEMARREHPRPERTGRILTDGWQLPQSLSRSRRQMAKLPADFLVDSLWPTRGGQTSRFGGVRCGTEGVRTHVRDGCGLSGRPGGGHRCGIAHLTSRGAVDETAPDLFRGTELATGEGP